MIDGLKKKFILVTMSFVSIILIVVFSVLCYSDYSRMEREIDQSLDRTLHMEMEQKPSFIRKDDYGNMPDDGMNFNSFLIELDDEGNVVNIESRTWDVDSTSVDQLLPLMNESNGKIEEYDLAYRKENTESGTRIAVVDISRMMQMFQSLVKTSLITGIGAFLAFLVLSYVLAGWMLKPVEESWRKQKEFIANASHELKTPLTVILADADIMSRTPNDTIGSKSEWLQSIKNEGTRMKGLIEDMLFLARNDAQKQERILQDCDLSQIALSCVLPVEAIAWEKGIEMETDVQEDILVKGDEKQLHRLIMIFLDNAVKYTPAKEKIDFKLCRENGHPVLVVHNTGSYIEKEDLEHIFDRFYRVDKARTFEGGYGLGLAIAKQIADMYNIQIIPSSSKSEGTTFKCVFN